MEFYIVLVLPLLIFILSKIHPSLLFYYLSLLNRWPLLADLTWLFGLLHMSAFLLGVRRERSGVTSSSLRILPRSCMCRLSFTRHWPALSLLVHIEILYKCPAKSGEISFRRKEERQFGGRRKRDIASVCATSGVSLEEIGKRSHYLIAEGLPSVFLRPLPVLENACSLTIACV